jgi:hypothetical protein
MTDKGGKPKGGKGVTTPAKDAEAREIMDFPVNERVKDELIDTVTNMVEGMTVEQAFAVAARLLNTFDYPSLMFSTVALGTPRNVAMPGFDGFAQQIPEFNLDRGSRRVGKDNAAITDSVKRGAWALLGAIVVNSSQSKFATAFRKKRGDFLGEAEVKGSAEWVKISKENADKHKAAYLIVKSSTALDWTGFDAWVDKTVADRKAEKASKE